MSRHINNLLGTYNVCAVLLPRRYANLELFPDFLTQLGFISQREINLQGIEIILELTQCIFVDKMFRRSDQPAPFERATCKPVLAKFVGG